MLFLHYGSSSSPLLYDLNNLFILFLFLELIIEYFKIFLLHPSLYFILLTFIKHICPFILFFLNILILKCITFNFRCKFIFTFLLWRLLLLFRLLRLFSKTSKILLLISRISTFLSLFRLSLFNFTLFDFTRNSFLRWLSLLTLLWRWLNFFRLFLFILKFRHFWICHFWCFLFLFRLNKRSNI